MGILLDIGFVIIILLCVVFGYKKGFFKSIAGFIGAVIAMFLAWVLAGLIANALYQGVFREKLIDNISSVLSNDALASFPEKAAQVVANLPGFLSNTLNNQGITSSQIEQSLQAAGSNAAPATADLISPAVIWLLQLLLTVILFFIFRVYPNCDRAIIKQFYFHIGSEFPCFNIVVDFLGYILAKSFIHRYGMVRL